jgi:hypothetical protein
MNVHGGEIWSGNNPEDAFQDQMSRPKHDEAGKPQADDRPLPMLEHTSRNGKPIAII